MTQTKPHELSERQLELVFNFPYHTALYLFKTPLTPSEAARRLGVPANVMHYRVKRLLEAGLLEVEDDNGRSRTYRAVADTFAVSPEVLPALTEAVPAMLDAMLGKLHRHALESIERELADLEVLTQDDPLTFELGKSLIIGPEARYAGRVNISTLSLSVEGYRRVLEAVADVFNEAQAGVGKSEGKTRRCTLAFIAFPGQGAM